MKNKELLKELKAKKEKDLLIDLKNAYENLRKLRFQAKTRQLKDINSIKKEKKKIAQILTILREKIETTESQKKSVSVMARENI